MFTSDDHTFVVCAYGESPYLGECVSSLMSQTVRSNIIISTSTPNDHIQYIANKNGLPLFINSGKPGIAHDWNCAIKHAKTPLVTIAHQDDVYLPEYVSSMLESVNSAEAPLIFFTNYGELRNDVEVDNRLILKIKRLLLHGARQSGSISGFKSKRHILSLGSAICCPSVTYYVPALPEPVFLDDMKCDLDWEAWERFSLLDGCFVYSPKILMRHRIHEGSETTALIENATRSREDLLMLEKFWPKPVAKLVNLLYSTSMNSNNV